MFTALAGLTAAVAGALLLFPGHGHVGVAAAIAISGWVGATTLAIILWRRGWLAIDPAARRRLPRIVLATAIMAIAILLGHHLIASLLDVTDTAAARIATLAVLVIAGLGVYLVAVELLGIARLGELRDAIRRRF
jgi:putative peptidoglycan lipid II flippase